jgi:hypothetical protein
MWRVKRLVDPAIGKTLSGWNGIYLSVKTSSFRHASEGWHPDPDSVRPEAAANQELDSSFRWNDDEKQGFWS